MLASCNNQAEKTTRSDDKDSGIEVTFGADDSTMTEKPSTNISPDKTGNNSIRKDTSQPAGVQFRDK